MKTVKIVRAIKGQEDVAAQAIADFYNEQAKLGARVSRALITAAGEDIIYTIFADKYDGADDDTDNDDYDLDNCDSIDDKSNDNESDDDDDDFLS